MTRSQRRGTISARTLIRPTIQRDDKKDKHCTPGLVGGFPFDDDDDKDADNTPGNSDDDDDAPSTTTSTSSSSSTS